MKPRLLSRGDCSLNQILEEIKEKYPDSTVRYRNKVSSGRGQSTNVSFLRVLVYLSDNDHPIEIVILNQKDYFNYRLEFEQAHKLYDLKKSRESASVLYPEEVFDIDTAILERRRNRQEEVIKNELSEFGDNQYS